MLRQKSLLLGKLVRTPEEAQKEAANGASFLLMGYSPSLSDLQRAKSLQRGGRVPVIPVIDGVEDRSKAEMQQVLQSNPDGICTDVNAIGDLSTFCGNDDRKDLEAAASAILMALKSGQTRRSAQASPSQVNWILLTISTYL